MNVKSPFDLHISNLTNILLLSQHHLSGVNWKKNTQCKGRELSFIHSPGDSLSDSSEELLQRGKGGAKIYMIIFLLEKNM